MRRNFQFDVISVIKWGGRLIDLHNVYDIASFGTDIQGTEAVLSFSRDARAAAMESLPPKVRIRCKGNVRIAFNDLNELAAPLNSEGIEIAYFNDSFNSANDWSIFVDEDMTARREPLGLHVSFINGFVVRIYCDMAELEVE